MSLACVILNYRNPEDTLACLGSLRAGPTDGLGIYLINNYPADGSGPGLRHFLDESGIDFRYIEPGFNAGFAGGCNIGIRAALEDGCSHVVILNNDTIVEPGFVPEITRLAAVHEGEVLAGRVTDATTGNPSHNIGRISPITGRVRHILDAGFRGDVDFVSGCLMVVPRAAFETCGIFDEGLFMYCEDLDLCLRFKRHGIRIRYCPSFGVRHDSSASVRKARLPKEYYIQRNQILVMKRSGSPLQILCGLACSLSIPLYAALRRPRLFPQTVRGVFDGLLGRPGKRHRE
jgi:GT2 family glycosyltransferase